MTRDQAEFKIMEHLKRIREIAKEYSPEDTYLSLFFRGNHLSIGNGPDPAKPIDCFEILGDGKGIYSFRRESHAEE